MCEVGRRAGGREEGGRRRRRRRDTEPKTKTPHKDVGNSMYNRRKFRSQTSDNMDKSKC